MLNQIYPLPMPLQILRPIDNLITNHLTLGISGFARAGKTIFITSLTQALLTADAWSKQRGQGPLAHFGPFERGELISARIRDDLHPQRPQFPFRAMRDAIATGSRWPEATTGVSHLIIDLEFRRDCWIGNGRKKLQLEIIDYPGEWLIDLPMLSMNYSEWSKECLNIAKLPERKLWVKPFWESLNNVENSHTDNEEKIIELSRFWREYLQHAAAAGYILNQPGRLLRPDHLRDSPILRLFPLPEEMQSTPLGQTINSRYQHYCQKVIRPFYEQTFSRMNRQVVLVDILRYLQLGEKPFNELQTGITQILASFRYGKGGALDWLKGIKTTHVLFALTKADHVVRGDRLNLEQLLRRMLAFVDEKNTLRATTLKHDVMALASIATTEDRKTISPPVREILYGLPAGYNELVQYDPGGIPLDMPPDWNEIQFQYLDFQPTKQLMQEPLYRGFPAINLGRALNFLIAED
jgi:uncharacterized protein